MSPDANVWGVVNGVTAELYITEKDEKLNQTLNTNNTLQLRQIVLADVCQKVLFILLIWEHQSQNSPNNIFHCAPDILVAQDVNFLIFPFFYKSKDNKFRWL